MNGPGPWRMSWARARDAQMSPIGHIILHKPGVAYRDIEFEGSREEGQANEYALGLLVPGFMITILIPFCGGDLSRLAKVFDVSTGTAEHGLVRVYE